MMRNKRDDFLAYFVYKDGQYITCYASECGLIACCRHNGIHLKAKERIALQRGKVVHTYGFTFVKKNID